MSDVLTINGSTINLVTTGTSLDLLVPHIKGGIPELHFTRYLGALATLPDPWSGGYVTLSMDGGTTTHFAGDVQGYVDRWLDPVGWVREYRALGLLNRANYIPITDEPSFTDTSVWNLPGDDPGEIPSRSGRTVGQIVQSILTMAVNATTLAGFGIGAYTSFSPPTLPSATLSDLAALTVIPPWRVTVSGERILAALEAFVQSVHPNHYLHVQPDGTIRFLDSRHFTPTTLTLGGDPRLAMPSLTRDYSDCYSQVEIRGNTLVKGITLQTSPWPGSSNPDGGLAEDFAWGNYNNTQAKANWTPACWNQPLSNGTASETGTCTCPDTTHVTLAVTGTYPANYWDQSATGVLGWIVLYADSLNGQLQQHVQARIVASTASSGGHITVTLDTALPTSAYNAYQLWGLTQNCSMVGRKYKVTNAAIAAALQQFFPYPVPFISSNGQAAEMTTSPQVEIQYQGNSATDLLQIDPVAGIIYFSRPTQTIFGMPQWPDNVRIFIPVAYGTLAAYAPPLSPTNSTQPGGYAGTTYSVEGIQRRKVITALDWKDYSNQANMALFASEFLDSVKDVVVEGVVPYHGLLSSYLVPGKAVSIAGSGYVTGWESLALPCVSVEVRFQPGPEGTSYHTTLHLSNRRGRYSSENFLRPNITGSAFGTDEVFGASYGPSIAQSAQFAQQSLEQIAANQATAAATPGAREAAGAIHPGDVGTIAGSIAGYEAQQGALAALGGQGILGAVAGQQAGVMGAVAGQQAAAVDSFLGQAAQFQTMAADTSGVQQVLTGMAGPGGLAGPAITAQQAQQAMEGGATARGPTAQQARDLLEGGMGPGPELTAQQARELMEGGG